MQQQGEERTGALKAGRDRDAAFAGIAYGLGWIYTAAFASQLRVYPEALGWGFSFLAVRTAFLVIVFLCFAAPVIYLFWNTKGFQRFWSQGPSGAPVLFHGVLL